MQMTFNAIGIDEVRREDTRKEQRKADPGRKETSQGGKGKASKKRIIRM